MNFSSPYKNFVFEDMSFDSASATAMFRYSFDSERFFTESVQFSPSPVVLNEVVLQSVLELAFWVIGVSYYKAFPTKSVIFKTNSPSREQAKFLSTVYSDGLSQFIFENKLSLEQLATFIGNERIAAPEPYNGEGTLVLQSGGKDSLLLATLLEEQSVSYQSWYISSSEKHPSVLDHLKSPLTTAIRTIDAEGLRLATKEGGLNGHVPVTYIVLSLALVQAVLGNMNTVLAAIGMEGEEPHAFVDSLPVNHQWSKTWAAELLFSKYVDQFISADIRVGSPLRGFSELRIAELFAEHCWKKFGHDFSSCNSANYQQGADNTTLTWCGECPKCANSYLLFAPFISINELRNVFSGQDLFAKPQLAEIFKGLLGIDGTMKPFECVGEVAELRLAYQMALQKHGIAVAPLPFEVPESSFDYKKINISQPWAQSFLK